MYYGLKKKQLAKKKLLFACVHFDPAWPTRIFSKKTLLGNFLLSRSRIQEIQVFFFKFLLGGWNPEENVPGQAIFS